MLAIESLVNLSSNPDVRPRVASAFSSSSLKKLVARVGSSEAKEDQFALAMLLANLGSHSTGDGRGCLGSALDWVPFKDLNVFDDLVAAMDAALAQCDWPPGSNAFHSSHRLCCLVRALADSPMMQAAYAAQLANFIQPLKRVVVAGGEAAGVACAALQELADSASNFGALFGDTSLTEAVVELRDYEGTESAASLLRYLEEYEHKVVISGGGVLWRPTELLAKVANEHEHVEWRLPKVKPELDRQHTQKQVKEMIDEVDVSNHSCPELLGILPTMASETAFLEAKALWSNAAFKDAEDAEKRLSTLVAYCEEVGCHAVGHHGVAPEITRRKLRMVASLLNGQDHAEKLPVLLLLAAHGGVCNVQKEVGVDAAYAQLTRTHAEHASRSSFEAYVFRILHEHREQAVESVSVEYCRRVYGHTNTHILVPIRNSIAESVGIRTIPDSHGHVTTTDDMVAELTAAFWQQYSIEAILANISAGLNELPRRIPYDVLITWLEKNAPLGTDSYSFLSASFDVFGHVCRATLEYALCRLGIFCGPTVLVSGPSALKVQIGAQEWHGLDAYMVLAHRWGFATDPDRCHKVLSELYEVVAGEGQASEPNDFKDFRTLLTTAEAELPGGQVCALSAQDWLIAGALVNRELLSPNDFAGFPKVGALLKVAHRHMSHFSTYTQSQNS
jgi:hypothetical protein